MLDKTLHYVINNPLELNLSYMPFIADGGLFVPTSEVFQLGDHLVVDLLLSIKNENLKIDGKVVWITPKSALHHVLPGVGIRFIGENAATVRAQIELNLEPSMEVGGYTYGLTDGAMKG
jgi:type IV pilus assembly protein PilZ